MYFHTKDENVLEGERYSILGANIEVKTIRKVCKLRLSSQAKFTGDGEISSLGESFVS